jgi:glutamate-5-semialdehyde dehydrogenase
VTASREGTESVDADVAALCARARRAARKVAPMSRALTDAARRAIAAGLRARKAEVLTANTRDVETARANGTSSAMLDRLALDDTRLEALARAVEEIAELPDPVGELITKSMRPSGVSVSRVRFRRRACSP